MKNKIYRLVSVPERLPENDGSYITNIGAQRFEFIGKGWTRGRGDLESVEWWLEEITTPDQAREMVAELCEQFDLLPSEEQRYEHATEVEHEWDEVLDGFRDGANFILNHIKGG